MVILGTMIHGTMTTSSKKDYLSILGLSPDFDDKDLKKAFRREARKWHPDLNKNDLNAEERFKLINEAYEYLHLNFYLFYWGHAEIHTLHLLI